MGAPQLIQSFQIEGDTLLLMLIMTAARYGSFGCSRRLIAMLTDPRPPVPTFTPDLITLNLQRYLRSTKVIIAAHSREVQRMLHVRRR